MVVNVFILVSVSVQLSEPSFKIRNVWKDNWFDGVEGFGDLKIITINQIVLFDD